MIPQTAGASIKNNIDIKSDSGSGNTGVKVNVNNQSGSSYSGTSIKSESSIRIHQSGEERSEVKINGEEYELVGPGDISIDNTSSDYLLPTTTPTENLTSAETDILTPTQAEGEHLLGSPDIKIESSGVIEIVVNLH